VSKPYTIHHGDCLDVLRTLGDASVDAVVTDPPYGLAFMGKKWDYDVPTVEVWAECLRVLKPGGHLLAFAGTRTQHRMAVRIEDAGFEIRDMIAWVYGSGFPKSLDVSKAIDKMDAGEEQERRRLRFTAWVRSTGVTARQIDEATGSNMGGHYTTASSQPAIMTREHLEACRHLLGEVPTWVEQEADIRSVESRNFLMREVVTRREMTDTSKARAGFSGPTHSPEYDGSRRLVAITAPATDAARKWSGWGTALKPAMEPITVARKPLIGTVAQNVLTHGTGAINIDACRIVAGQRPTMGAWVQDQYRCSSCVADAASLHKQATPATGASFVQGDASLSANGRGESPRAATCKTGTSCCDGTTAGGTSTNLNTGECGKMPTARYQTGTRSTTSTETNSTTGLPTCDVCGSEITDPCTSGSTPANKRNLQHAQSSSVSAAPAGRWPSNLIHDGSGEVLERFPETASGAICAHHERSTDGGNGQTHGKMAGVVGPLRGADSGSAARFFYCAKASRTDRNDGDDNKHPTVKPTDLMRYLVRLVTPPGGIVLDPFMGSGSTGRGAILEGFRFVGIEREAEYVKIAEARIAESYTVGFPPLFRVEAPQ
jgi:hypothetical protein